ncbi:galactoside-binding lectin [Ancylostoma caninum]|uniref:Galectin n=1 Tax=Ancylostoma caninum TaxID=29170 RepID=A0A368F7K4_ANCCA|nr:galactoside-binding lectin [Ancylostoma caninum]
MAFETNYPIPYRSKLTEPFEPGQTLTVKGKTGEDSVRFTINLHNAAADFSGNDVPLHVSVRFDEGKHPFPNHPVLLGDLARRLARPILKKNA